MLETTGRKSGQPRHTAVGGKVVDNQFWMVSEHGDHSDYVHNIKADPAVRVRIGGQWRSWYGASVTRRRPVGAAA